MIVTYSDMNIKGFKGAIVGTKVEGDMELCCVKKGEVIYALHLPAELKFDETYDYDDREEEESGNTPKAMSETTNTTLNNLDESVADSNDVQESFKDFEHIVNEE